MNSNGQIILEALQDMGEPATFASIVTYIAGTTKEDPDLVEECVMDTLNEGVRLGFIERTNRTYYTPLLDDDDCDKDAKCNNEYKSESEAEDSPLEEIELKCIASNGRKNRKRLCKRPSTRKTAPRRKKSCN